MGGAGPLCISHKRRGQVQGDSRTHNGTTDVFRKSIDVARRADEVKWKMDVVKITMNADAAKDAMRETIAMLDSED